MSLFPGGQLSWEGKQEGGGKGGGGRILCRRQQHHQGVPRLHAEAAQSSGACCIEISKKCNEVPVQIVACVITCPTVRANCCREFAIVVVLRGSMRGEKKRKRKKKRGLHVQCRREGWMNGNQLVHDIEHSTVLTQDSHVRSRSLVISSSLDRLHRTDARDFPLWPFREKGKIKNKNQSRRRLPINTVLLRSQNTYPTRATNRTTGWAGDPCRRVLRLRPLFLRFLGNAFCPSP